MLSTLGIGASQAVPMKPLDVSRFHQDEEFSKLLVGRRDVDLVVAALEIARDADPELSFQSTLNWIQERADQLTLSIASCVDERAMLEQVVQCLSGEFGLRGDEECFAMPESSFLPQVIETKRGLPITLSLLYCAVADRLGIALEMAPAPQHVVCRLKTDQAVLYVDPFTAGRILSEAECLAWLSVRTQIDPQALLPTLKPAAPRVVIERMLLNLKNLYVRQTNWAALWPVQYRLTALNPTSVEACRDLGIIAAHSGRHGIAVTLLRECAPQLSEPDRAAVMKQLAESARKLAQWN